MIIGYLHFDVNQDHAHFTLGKKLHEFDDATTVRLLDDIIEELKIERDFRVHIQDISSSPQ